MKRMILFFVIVILIMNACQNTQQNKTNPIEKITNVENLNPDEVVKLYFESWNDKQYNVMYSLISDGFKQIEPTAKTFNEFATNIEKFYDTSSGVRVLKANEAYKNDKEAGVEYTIEIANKDGTKKEFSSIYTLKKRASGWKLIHPYGKNIDTN